MADQWWGLPRCCSPGATLIALFGLLWIGGLSFALGFFPVQNLSAVSSAGTVPASAEWQSRQARAAVHAEVLARASATEKESDVFRSVFGEGGCWTDGSTASQAPKTKNPALLLCAHLSARQQLSPVFDKAVMVVVDALRAEFLFGGGKDGGSKEGGQTGLRNGFPFVNQLLSRQDANTGEPLLARPFVAAAQAPTVTLPRLKALLSGTIPSFVDFALNFNSPVLSEDNLVTQLATDHSSAAASGGSSAPPAVGRRRNLVLYGDDTWLNMFPVNGTDGAEGVWSEVDGVSSFFVQDTVEVDFNVTRHLDSALRYDVQSKSPQTDFPWDFMVLHFLGLDHVGHSDGPTSTLMYPKQRAMDQVLHQVWEAVSARDAAMRKNQTDSADSVAEPLSRSLILLISDHGMNSVGNHGGSQRDETEAVAVFFADDGKNAGVPDYQRKAHSGSHHYQVSRWKVPKLSQIDVCPTLALLLGIPIPKNSMGVLSHSVMHWALQDHGNAASTFRLLSSSAVLLHQLQDLAAERGVLSDELVNEIRSAVSAHAECLIVALRDPGLPVAVDCAHAASEKYSHASFLLQEDLSNSVLSYIDSRLTLGILFFIISLCVATPICCGGLLATFPLRASGDLLSDAGTNMWLFLAPLLSLQVLSLVTSSFVEEEHQTWYSISTTLFCVFLVTSMQTATRANLSAEMKGTSQKVAFLAVVCMGVMRVIRAMNQTGNKWLDIPDFGDWLSIPDNAFVYSVLTVAATAILSLPAIDYRVTNGWITVLVYRTCVLVAFAVVTWLKIARITCGNQSLPCPLSIFASAVENRITLERWALSALFVSVLTISVRAKSSINFLSGLTASLGLFFGLLHRPQNVILLALLFLLGRFVVKMFCEIVGEKPDGKAKDTTPLVAIWFHVFFIVLGRVAFFAFGNSNSLASFDIAGAYTGLRDFYESVVGMNVAIIAASGPLMVLLQQLSFVEAIAGRVSNRAANGADAVLDIGRRSTSIIVAWRSLELFGFCTVASLLRYHLFVWSVFAPKLLYELAFLAWDTLHALVVLRFARSLSKRSPGNKEN